jgi:hypothetical protein
MELNDYMFGFSEDLCCFLLQCIEKLLQNVWKIIVNLEVWPIQGRRMNECVYIFGLFSRSFDNEYLIRKEFEGRGPSLICGASPKLTWND